MERSRRKKIWRKTGDGGWGKKNAKRNIRINEGLKNIVKCQMKKIYTQTHTHITRIKNSHCRILCRRRTRSFLAWFLYIIVYRKYPKLRIVLNAWLSSVWSFSVLLVENYIKFYATDGKKEKESINNNNNHR